MQVKLSKFNFYTFVVMACVIVFMYCAYNFWIMVQPKDRPTIMETTYSETEIDKFETIEDVELTEPTEPIEPTELTEPTKPTDATESTDVTESTEIATSPSSPVSLGKFKLTAYCPCSECCGKWANNRPVDDNGNVIVYGSIGEILVAGVSIAVDPDVIQYGTEVVINGHTYKAQDCGNGIEGNDIDIYMLDHDDALEFGVQYAEVFLADVN